MLNLHFNLLSPDEKLNAASHGIGIILCLIGAWLLIVKASSFGNTWHIVASLIYCVSLLMVYISSTVYHVLPIGKAKSRWRIFDHIAIFWLIAGTHTPFLLTVFRNLTGLVILTVVWIIALIGTVLKLFFTGKFKLLSTILYVGMGTVILVIIRPFAKAIPLSCLYYILGGGAAYLIGTLFYLNKRIYYSHGIWHLFVLLGSILHYLAIYLYLVSDVSS